ncbi:hypothetical protein TNCV_2656321 [Trichonephila clavipes]|nr:hypothetical protein TNCV_2656321 [Trichonephila clavipes]
MGYGEGSGPVGPPPLCVPQILGGPQHLEKIRSSLYPGKVCAPLEQRAVRNRKKVMAYWRRVWTYGALPPPLCVPQILGDRNTLKKLDVACTLEKSAHPWNKEH